MSARYLSAVLLALLPFLFLFPAKSASAATAKPNFVLIFIDDMGYGDIGPYGSKLNRTPHLDRMAEEGMLLTSFYAAPVCSASRAQVMTGSYAPRVSVPGVFFPQGPKGLNPEENTVAELLQKEGYATMCVGKWHLGDQPEFLPTNHGFDHYYGIPYSNDMNRKALKDGRNVCPLLRDDKVEELLDGEGQTRVTEQYTKEAVKFIKTKREQPFFLYFAHTAVHVPIFPGKRFQGRSKNGGYGDWVEEIDWSVGEVMRALKDSGVDEDTLVVFTSDNGPWASKGKNGGVATPLRGSKGGTLEGGVREPTIVRWPGKIAKGSRCDAIAGNIDFLPTFVSLAGGMVPAKPKIDGRDISGLLLGKTAESPHEAWFYYKGTQLKAVRQGSWKLALSPQSLGMGIKERPEDLVVKKARLYNLDEEIGEVTNVAAENPEVVRRLQALAEKMRADIGDGKAGPGVRPAGQVENPVMLYPAEARKSGRKAAKGQAGKPFDWDTLKLGDVIAPDSAPKVAGQAISIRCAASSASPDGVLLAHGGSAVGYAIYLQKGELVFAVRTGGSEIRRARIKVQLNREMMVQADLFRTGRMMISTSHSGESLTIEGVKLITRHPQEDFCVGHDNKNPVDPEAPQARWKGSLKGLKVVVGNAAKK